MQLVPQPRDLLIEVGDLIEQQRPQLTNGVRQPGVGVFNRLGQPSDMRRSARRVDRLRALANQQVARAEQHDQQALLGSDEMIAGEADALVRCPSSSRRRSCAQVAFRGRASGVGAERFRTPARRFSRTLKLSPVIVTTGTQPKTS